jgi:hypothetical protein
VGCHHKVLARCWRIDCTWLLESSFSETQSTFVERRQILDGILIANELIDEAKQNNKKFNLLKVDFEKVYDSVD